MSIFISIASYRDPELTRTINSAIENANNPEDLYFGVVIQELPKKVPDLTKIKNIKIIEMSPKAARGAGFARALAMDLYDNQDYFLQIDSHTIFTPGWDSECINQLKLAQDKSKNNKIIISAFPQPYIIESNRVNVLKQSKDYAVYPTKQIPLQRKNGDWTAKRVEFENNDTLPEISTTVLGGFMFATGNIVKEVPYDPEISFLGEELCFAVRAWTRGWDIYSPKKVILYHFYFRANYSKVWLDTNIRKISWKELEDQSKDKQKHVLTGKEPGIYGIGKKRDIKKYENITGISFRDIYFSNNSDSDTIDSVDGK